MMRNKQTKSLDGSTNLLMEEMEAMHAPEREGSNEKMKAN
jgi:hypothetical protein